MIFETYSQRQQSAAASDDIYQYEEVPQKLRVQMQQILRDAIGPHYRIDAYAMSTPDHNPGAWEFIHKALCREFGVHSLANASTEGQEVINSLGVCSVLEFLDT